MFGPFVRPSREASSLAAAMLVVVQALTGLAFILVIMSEQADTNFLWAIGAVFLLAGFLFWLSFKPVSKLKDTMAWVRSRRARPDPFDFTIARREAAMARFGTNAPPSLEELRVQRETSVNNWVPSRTRERRLRDAEE
jgi:hypothetical protein